MEHHSIFCSVLQTVSVGVCVSHSFIIHWWLLKEQIPLTTKWDMSTSPHSLWSPMCELWVLTLQPVSLPVWYVEWCYCSYSHQWLFHYWEEQILYLTWINTQLWSSERQQSVYASIYFKQQNKSKEFPPFEKSQTVKFIKQNTAATVF